MAAGSAREVVLAAIEAIYSHDPAQAAVYYHDDIDYIGYAPIDFFPTMGARRGKADVMQTITSVQERYSDRRYEIEFIVADDDRVAVMLRVHLQKQANDRIVQFQTGHFYRVQDGLIVQQRQFFDSFDLLQQVMEVDLAEVLMRRRLGL